MTNWLKNTQIKVQSVRGQALKSITNRLKNKQMKVQSIGEEANQGPID